MRPTLFPIPDKLPPELGGFSVFGYGVLLVGWLLFSLALVGWLVRRQGFNADTRSYLPVLFVVAAVIVAVLPLLAQPGEGLPIRGYGVMMLIGVVTGVGLAAWRAERCGLSADMIISLAFWMFVAGIAGARLFHVIEYWESSYRKLHADGSLDLPATFWQVIDVPSGGLVVYGSLIAGLGALIWFVYRRGLPGLAVADLIAPSMLLGLAFGRIGCLMNGCCYGGICEQPWGIYFPKEPAYQRQLSLPYQRQLGHGWLYGIHIAVQPDDTLVVNDVKPGLADNAPVRVGDRVQTIDGRAFEKRTEDGREISVTAQLREFFADKSTLAVQLDTHRGGASVVPTTIYVPWWPNAKSQAERRTPEETLTRGFGVQFGSISNTTLVVADIRPDSAAAARGLKQGKRVRRVDGRLLSSLGDVDQLFWHKARLKLLLDGATEPVELTFAPPRQTPRLQPTQIYSAVNALLLCLFLLAFHPFRRRDGVVFGLLITLYPITRFLLEIIRTDEAAMFGTQLSISQIVSVMFLVGMIAYWFYVMRQPAGQLWTAEETSNNKRGPAHRRVGRTATS